MITVNFGDKNSYKDWGLILKEKSIPFPEPKTPTVESEGIGGEIDLTETLTGRVQYRNRTLSFTFTKFDEQHKWADIMSEIAAYIHGKKKRISTNFDEKYYYMGRCSINDFKTDKSTATIVIACNCEPYKYSLNDYGPDEDWMWNSFDFEEDEINFLGNILVSGTTDISVVGEEIDTVPIFDVTKVSGKAAVSANGINYELAAGRNRFPDLLIGREMVILRFTGNFTVVMEYRGRRL